MAWVKVFATNPEFPFTEELSADRRTLTISLLNGYTMPYDTNFTIKLFGASVGCRPLIKYPHYNNCHPEPAEYSFKTMNK